MIVVNTIGAHRLKTADYAFGFNPPYHRSVADVRQRTATLEFDAAHCDGNYSSSVNPTRKVTW